MALDATVGGQNSNSLITVARADEIINERSGDLSDWTGASQQEKERDLISATRLLSQRRYKGYKTSNTQALPFPRIGICDEDDILYNSALIPKPVEYATAELAFVLRRDPTLLDDTGLENFDSISTGDTSITPKARQAGTLPAHVQRFFIGLTKGGAGITRLVRG
jgi:hypothetical protein